MVEHMLSCWPLSDKDREGWGGRAAPSRQPGVAPLEGMHTAALLCLPCALRTLWLGGPPACAYVVGAPACSPCVAIAINGGVCKF